MKIFLSWSGELSRELAEALRDWLPAVLQSVKPFFTPNDIEKGARWSKDIAQELETSSYGIFCLTKENLLKPWIMFEAGALSKRIDASRVCPVLFGVDNADLEGPLVQFQASPFNESEIRKLMKTLNSGLGEQRLEDNVLTSVFDMWWPRLNEKVTKILERHAAKPVGAASTRPEREILEEILQLARLNSSTTSKSRRIERADRAEIADRAEQIDPSAMLHSFRHILELCRHIEEIGLNQDMPRMIKGIFEPLQYIHLKSDYSNYRHDIQEVIERIEETIHSIERSSI
ncbi:toll/interleukin-1 receptor domain-containing protein [Pseudomonas sp. CFBP 8770]|uniref:toll/interleukin-1 receptor domain-containing protein n=1 Tax=unclassified Pseudomonas TaxID=196821 RepID=UPI00177F31B8|nr:MULTISPECIES: toll/interleukin-1 receptor domain-containing protein [unclassified Pseudomonas]MBD8473781.1 toll/interleukin-1 receptor domain-containing protein [Pseudomonas sp. CFBP 8773]MBD8646910.1 toll/interleukin-1 receptor domain-containing protein [Pseudomonas sp. CFBP 8770]